MMRWDVSDSPIQEHRRLSSERVPRPATPTRHILDINHNETQMTAGYEGRPPQQFVQKSAFVKPYTVRGPPEHQPPARRSDEFESTEYMSPPGGLAGNYVLPGQTHQPTPRNETFLESEQDYQYPDGGPTVKDILESIVDKLRHTPSGRGSGLQLDLSNGVQEVHPGVMDIPEDDLDDTLSEQDILSQPDEENITIKAAEVASNHSRHSVTDYFKKYPVTKHRGPSGSHQPMQTFSPQRIPERVYEHEEEHVEEELHLPIQDVDTSEQEDLYKGTALDSSLSTIRETESVKSLGAKMSVSSTVSALDEDAFREGLANLDANIARIQQSLKQDVIF